MRRGGDECGEVLGSEDRLILTSYTTLIYFAEAVVCTSSFCPLVNISISDRAIPNAYDSGTQPSSGLRGPKDTSTSCPRFVDRLLIVFLNPHLSYFKANLTFPAMTLLRGTSR